MAASGAGVTVAVYSAVYVYMISLLVHFGLHFALQKGHITSTWRGATVLMYIAFSRFATCKSQAQITLVALEPHRSGLLRTDLKNIPK